MLAFKLLVEGLGLGCLLYLICAVGIRNGAIGMVHLYDRKVQDRVVELGMTTREAIQKRGRLFRSVCLPFYYFGKSTTPDQLDQTWVNCLNLFGVEYNA